MATRPVPKSGEVWNINFDPQVGREQSGIRPALVVSHDRFNDLPNGRHIVVPMSSKDRGLPHHVRVAAPEGGLTTDSVIMCDQVRAQSILRFHDRRGVVGDDTLNRVRTIVAMFIDR